MRPRPVHSLMTYGYSLTDSASGAMQSKAPYTKKYWLQLPSGMTFWYWTWEDLRWALQQHGITTKGKE